MNKNTLGIIGAGDLGQQIAHYAISDGHYEHIVFFDDFISKDTIVKKYKVIGNINDVLNSYKSNVFDKAIIAVGYKHLKFREKVFENLAEHIEFATIVHSSTYVDQSSKIGKGVFIYPNCVIDSNVVIKNDVVINISTSICHDSIINDHTFLSPCIIISGFCNIGKRCNLGVGTTVIDSININDDIQTGGATVVVNNLSKKGLYFGNPARFIK
ncbi:acetyltransferase [Winogradskyella ouciana]|uniref:Sugar O-acyltransferase, sialic acid O-acetyltransferase NeuD family n=1 Tax=Winogradskyella ouciana TaxID=2608631 RepID=A0A7K1GE55_9FLAO|nr:acetyltransferase [Winogradskyella ouciana]MTE27381.1 hypothetical protein [Winogradskyella ouciana]